jgi:hypothetical protein
MRFPRIAIAPFLVSLQRRIRAGRLPAFLKGVVVNSPLRHLVGWSVRRLNTGTSLSDAHFAKRDRQKMRRSAVNPPVGYRFKLGEPNIFSRAENVEFVLGPIVQSRRELEDGFVKAGLAQSESSGGVTHPTKIEEKRFLRKRTKKVRRKGVSVFGCETSGGMIPFQSAASKDNEDVRRAVSRDPIFGLFRNPRRGGRLWRSEQNEEKGLIEGLANARPKGRTYREIGLISKNVQRAQLVPGLGKAMQGRLKGGSNITIRIMAVRYESAIRHQPS